MCIRDSINPGAGLDLSSLETAQVEIGEKEGLADTLLAIIPVNPVRALADGDMPVSYTHLGAQGWPWRMRLIRMKLHTVNLQSR